MKYIEGIDRAQLVLFPERLDELISDDNPVRIIDVFVDQLDLVGMGFKNAILKGWSAGAPCFSPECLIKLYIYGYFKKTRSSRKLMELSRTNIEAMWLLERLMPDFRTISDFRKDNARALKKVFKAFVRMCIELEIYSAEIGVQDGSKFRASNSKDNNVTENKLQKKIEFAEKKLDEYLEELDKFDKEESDSQKYTKEEIEAKIEQLKERKEYYDDLQDKMKEEGITQISFTDPESRLMKMPNGGFNVAYNIQTVVDPVSHMVGYVEVTNQCNDLGQLSPTMIEVKEDLGIEVVEAVADKGYEDRADLLECLKNGIIPHVPSKSGEESYEFELDYEEATITEELLNSTKPEDIQTCLEAGVVPNVYEDKGIEVSVHEVEQHSTDEAEPQSSFTLNEEATAVICPNGSTLNKVARLHNKLRTRYASRSACGKCEEKCTTSSFKQVDLKDGQTVSRITKYRPVKKVKIKLTMDMGKICNRKCVVEHPFGTVKYWCDGSYTLLRGIEKVSADVSLMFLAYNLKRAIKIMGVQEMIEKMRVLSEDIFALLLYFIQFIQKRLIFTLTQS